MEPPLTKDERTKVIDDVLDRLLYSNREYLAELQALNARFDIGATEDERGRKTYPPLLPKS